MIFRKKKIYYCKDKNYNKINLKVGKINSKKNKHIKIIQENYLKRKKKNLKKENKIQKLKFFKKLKE